MSHYTLLVFGDNVEEQLERFYEQTEDRAYLQFVDVEDEERNAYENKKVDIVVFADGSLHNKYEEQFRHFDIKDMSTQYKYPEGSIVRDGKFCELFPTFEDYMSQWCGHNERDEDKDRYGYWTNPNGMYDWYVVGGRWSGFFKPQEGKTGEIGEPGSGGNVAREGWVDSIKIADIDWAAMYADASKEANEMYDKVEKIANGRPLPSWGAYVAEHDGNARAAREAYSENEVAKDFAAAQIFVWDGLHEAFGTSREEYVAKCTATVGTTFAILKDDVWHVRGQVVQKDGEYEYVEESQAVWSKKMRVIFDSVDPQTIVTLIDYHN